MREEVKLLTPRKNKLSTKVIAVQEMQSSAIRHAENKCTKLIHLDPSLSVISLNVNGLNFVIKIQRLTDG